MLTSTQTVLNEMPVLVVYEDGSSEEITVRQLKLRALYKYIDALAADEVPKIVALCCDRPPDWVDTLSVKSYSALSKIIVEQNFIRAMEIVQSDPIASAKCSKLLVMLSAAEGDLLKIYQSSSVGPASTESAVETSSGSST